MNSGLHIFIPQKKRNFVWTSLLSLMLLSTRGVLLLNQTTQLPDQVKRQGQKGERHSFYFSLAAEVNGEIADGRATHIEADGKMPRFLRQKDVCGFEAARRAGPHLHRDNDSIMGPEIIHLRIRVLGLSVPVIQGALREAWADTIGYEHTAAPNMIGLYPFYTIIASHIS